MLTNARALFLGFLAAIVVVGISNPGASGSVGLAFLLIGAIFSLAWGVKLYLKIHQKDPEI